MRPPLSPREQGEIRDAFDGVVNMTPRALRAWLDTDESRRVGVTRRGESESIGRQSARRILEIRARPAEDLTDADYAHMKKVVGYARRHLAQRPWGDVTHTRWRWSLMNWGHDPLLGRVTRGA
ncbi:DUF3140 domain-containing protein [Phenylobacterium sp.]|uniref:DUF3140 domain-containing protein n=1 Tax=Phenylobacterium sp. TaxID=1871053 RepID=UPI002733116F|nr:DUF3140 domain-containing protein [Phenylobacterium sp.]MDP3658842.1 DUF3140 domain-containing protein [Phenylobacterium sp.]